MTRTLLLWPRISAGIITLGLLQALPVVSAAAENVVPVAVAQSETMPIIREVRVTGTVTSPRSAELSTQVAGVVAKLEVEEGDRVERDQVLLELDRELAAHTLDRTRAEVKRTATALADARRRLADGQRLVRDELIPESEVESLEAEVQSAEAELAASRAEARYQASVVARHAIRAPFAGVISRRATDLGEWVTPGTPVLELVDTDRLRFDFRAAQEIYPLLERTTAVMISLDALPQQHFPGGITAIVPVSDAGARTFLLRVEPKGENHPAITPGMSALATLSISTDRIGVVVPRDALLRHPDGRVTVWTLEHSESAPRVHERQVKLGLEFGDHVEIREGLEAGVTVVVEGNEILRDGQAVRIHGGG